MSSIRVFLVVTLVATITLINFISSLQGYRKSMQEAQKLFDAHLAEFVKVLSIYPHQPLANSFPPIMLNHQEVDPLLASDHSSSYQSTLAFQIWGSDEAGQQLIAHSSNAPLSPMTDLHGGYGYINFNGYRWRSLTYFQTEHQHWIMAAERDDIRYSLGESVVLESILPIIIGIPIAGIMIWFIVGIGVKPIDRLASQLRHKEATDLSPIGLDGVPKELTLLSSSANELLQRLEASFSREKRFAADAAHELRTPISALKVHIHNLTAEEDKPHESSLKLKEGIDRMGHLVEQILLLNRTAPDHFMAQFSELDLYALTQQVISDNYSKISDKNQKISMEGEETLIKGDLFSLQTMVQNLLTNASKYTPKNGEIIVRVSAEKNRKLFRIMDSGVGIPDQQHSRVFERFYRLDGDRHSSNMPGCGLGLAIVKHIVDLHRATISLGNSPFESGLSVTVSFPKEDSLSKKYRIET